MNQKQAKIIALKICQALIEQEWANPTELLGDVLITSEGQLRADDYGKVKGEMLEIAMSISDRIIRLEGIDPRTHVDLSPRLMNADLHGGGHED